MRKEKGITLVALIITIIVMLILVAVSVAVVVNSDLIGQAEKAGEAYNSASDDVQNIGHENRINVNGEDRSVDYYMNKAGLTE